MIFGKPVDESEKLRNCKHQQLKEWHLWFAWWPVILETLQIAWLCKVQRKAIRKGPEHYYWFYEYKQTSKILESED